MSKKKLKGCGCGCLAAVFVLCILAAITVALGNMLRTGIREIGAAGELPGSDNYVIQGIDVSAYQGDIDWEVLSDNNIYFAFIKATEGSDFVDETLDYNLEAALNTDLKVGAYHFFNFDETGSSQAENFIAHVPKNDAMLPPVVDIEFYAPYNRFLPPSTDSVIAELKVLLDTLEAYYGKKPIIYTSKYPYSVYIAGNFEDYKLWIANYDENPTLADGRAWTFWQYSEHGVLPGYSGAVEHIDLNVYRGSYAEFITEFGL
ncbi:MAG: GH25 family lysozyme [Eubacterium sp.]|nr:GH25 family lysozyme [Eubacterium sp.]